MNSRLIFLIIAYMNTVIEGRITSKRELIINAKKGTIDCLISLYERRNTKGNIN